MSGDIHIVRISTSVLKVIYSNLLTRASPVTRSYSHQQALLPDLTHTSRPCYQTLLTPAGPVTRPYSHQQALLPDLTHTSRPCYQTLLTPASPVTRPYSHQQALLPDLTHTSKPCYQTLLTPAGPVTRPYSHQQALLPDLTHTSRPCYQTLLTPASPVTRPYSHQQALLPDLTHTSRPCYQTLLTPASPVTRPFLLFHTVYMLCRFDPICCLGNNALIMYVDVATESFKLGDFEESGSGARGNFLRQRTAANEIVLCEKIGQGRYGAVWRGLWFDKNVAVKKFLLSDKESWQREKEIYETSFLRHENILTYLAADQCSQGMYATHQPTHSSIYPLINPSATHPSTHQPIHSSTHSSIHLPLNPFVTISRLFSKFGVVDGDRLPFEWFSLRLSGPPLC